jgi:fructose-1,6-bisphosphatase/inositol monophosphatase family enzyme
MDWIKIGQECVTSAIKVLRELKEVKAFNNEINVQTNADIKSHNTIKEILTKSGASCNLVSEEDEKTIKINGGNNKVQIIIDPIDYTHLFLRGELSFCSIGLMILIDGFPKYSFIGDISNNDIFHCDEKYSYKNNQKIKVPTKIQGKNIILGWAPYKLRAKRFVDALADLTDGDYFIYNFGGMLQAAKIADGKYDAYMEVRASSLHEFAAAPIVERAGGIISTLQGKPIEWNPSKKQTLLISRNKKIHKDILDQFKDKDYEEF